MTIYEHWLIQKEQLRPLLAEQNDMAGVVYQVRHALLQTEQNALAELTDDILRQQAGVLLGCIKNSAGLLETHITAQVWVPQSMKKTPKADRSLGLFSLVALLLAGVWCALKGAWLPLVLIVASVSLALTGWIKAHSSASNAPAQAESRVTLQPDADRLFTLLDGQMRAVDRYLNDFLYLNEQLRGASECTDPAAVTRAVDLMEALYDCDESDRAPAEEAARKLLESLGMQVLEYSEETSRLFNALPSKNTTRTLSPAIISMKEQRLLRRGTAAVRIDAA